jgi:hypothetical protein
MVSADFWKSAAMKYWVCGFGRGMCCVCKQFSVQSFFIQYSLNFISGHTDPICDMECDGTQMVSADDKGTIILWQTGDTFRQIMKISGEGWILQCVSERCSHSHREQFYSINFLWREVLQNSWLRILCMTTLPPTESLSSWNWVCWQRLHSFLLWNPIENGLKHGDKRWKDSG